MDSRSKSDPQIVGQRLLPVGEEAGEQLQRGRELLVVDERLGLAGLLDRDLLVQHDHEAADLAGEVGAGQEVHRRGCAQLERSTRRVRMPSSNVQVASPTIA